MSDVEAIKNEHEGLFQALKNEDVDWVTGHYAEDVSRFHQEGGLDIGWTSEKANDFKKLFNDGLKLILNSWEFLDIRTFGEFGLSAGYLDGGWQFPDGTKHISKMRFSYVWAKIDGRWKEIHHHVSDLKGELRI
jgi:ketosteroid isomerase-like protein